MAEQKILVESLLGRKGLKRIKFKTVPEYEFPVAEIDKEVAERIIDADERDNEAAMERYEIRVAEINELNQGRKKNNRIAEPVKPNLIGFRKAIPKTATPKKAARV